MSYSKTVVKTLPFLGKCLIFTVLCWNLFYFMPVAPPLFTTAEFGILVALFVSFLPMRVTSFAFLAVSELAVFYLLYDLFFALAKAAGAGNLFLRVTLDGSVVVIVWILHLTYGLVRAKRIVTTTYTVPTDRALPEEKLRILQLSDMHPGRFETKRFLKRLYAIVENAKPDMIVLTGDIFDEFTQASKFKAYCRFFEETRPKYGTWYVFGNHDTDWHWHRPDHTREDICERFAEAGIHILEDECTTICSGTIRIAGRRDMTEERLPPDELLDDGFGGLTVLLCHEPVELNACAEAGADVTFAGHTHGGQIFPLGFLMKHVTKTHEMNDGIREVLPGKYAVVSCGVGTWGYPIRTEGRSEVVVVDIEENL